MLFGCKKCGVSGLGQTYPASSMPKQMPYSNVLLQGWSDASGNLSSSWQGYYLATFQSGILPPILSNATVLSSVGRGTLDGQLTLVVTDAQVQAILHGNNAATPASNYIPNQVVSPSAASSKALASQTAPPTNPTNPILGTTGAMPPPAPTQSSDVMVGSFDVSQAISTYGIWLAVAGVGLLLLSQRRGN